MMRGVDITLDVTALKPMYGFPEEAPKDDMTGNFVLGSDIYGDGSVTADGGRKGDITFSNEILNYMGSFIVTDQDMSDQIGIAVSDAIDRVADKSKGLLGIDKIQGLTKSMLESFKTDWTVKNLTKNF